LRFKKSLPKSRAILACTAKGNRVILLHSFQKKSQKTPKQELEIAAQRKKSYLQRHDHL